MAYQERTAEFFDYEIKRINELFDRFLQSNGFDDITFQMNSANLLLVIKKVDQRKHYYKEFHGIDMSELKEISLLCFWLVKFKPYYIKDDVLSANESINEKFSVYLILHTIRTLLQTMKSSEASINNLPKEYIYELVYSLRFRDISKEALILLTETIALMSGIMPYKELDISNVISDSEIE